MRLIGKIKLKKCTSLPATARLQRVVVSVRITIDRLVIRALIKSSGLSKGIRHNIGN